MWCKQTETKLPTAQLLVPKAYDSLKIKHLLDRSKFSQKYYYDKSRASKDRPPLTPGEEVRVEPCPGKWRWSPAVVVQKHSPPGSQSFAVTVSIFTRAWQLQISHVTSQVMSQQRLHAAKRCISQSPQIPQTLAKFSLPGHTPPTEAEW